MVKIKKIIVNNQLMQKLILFNRLTTKISVICSFTSNVYKLIKKTIISGIKAINLQGVGCGGDDKAA